ncbi:hypothetical protein DES35_101926 [Schleiferia thermophila]|jgi:hypothetical protein|uniref:Uncharacterized protein n=1 Tax=Schleiferia thermophila TaxID=884107 RepID=A0A369AB68_9FLAO|nr:hypothetical protein DES35_101926 [Schleiferia thermophila]
MLSGFITIHHFINSDSRQLYLSEGPENSIYNKFIFGKYLMWMLSILKVNR